MTSRDYSLGKIYKICGNGLTYYGSTCETTLARRLAKHRGNYRCYLNDSSKTNYLTSFKCLEDENAYISLVETYPCNSKDELTARERYYIENNDCVNKVMPGRTTKEYREQNKEHYKEYDKKYYELNKEKIQEYQKEYSEKHKEQIQKYKKEYSEQNKEKIREKQNEKMSCEICGGNFTYVNKLRHLKSQKHQEALENNTK